MTEFYMAPMEGVTTYVFRNVFDKYYNGIDKYYTPFVASSKLKGREKSEVSRETNKCTNLIPQILANNEKTFMSIVGQLKNMGYEEVNLNIGCPSKTVTVKGRGAGMLYDLLNLERFLDSIFEKCDLKISIKSRIGVSSLNEWEDILKVYRKFPIKELIIHTRLLDEMYTGKGHVDSFKLAQDMLSIPLCYNGEIKDEESFADLKKECPDIKSVMLGRGLVSDIMLAERLKRIDVENIDDISDSSKEILSDKRFIDFHKELLEEYIKVMPGEVPVLFKMKELWAFWKEKYNLSDKELKEIRKANSINQYASYIDRVLTNIYPK